MTMEIEKSVYRLDEDGESYVDRPKPGEDAEFYSVYMRYTNQCAQWVADFAQHDDAEFFVNSYSNKV